MSENPVAIYHEGRLPSTDQGNMHPAADHVGMLEDGVAVGPLPPAHFAQQTDLSCAGGLKI
jgi:hypothetical protein